MTLSLGDIGAALAIIVSLTGLWRFFDFVQKDKIQKARQEEKLDGRLTSLETKIVSSCKDSESVPDIENRVKNLEQKAETVSSRLDNHDTKSNDISGRLTRIEIILVEKIEIILGEMEKKIDSLLRREK